MLLQQRNPCTDCKSVQQYTPTILPSYIRDHAVVHECSEGQTDRKTDRKTDRQTDKQKDRQTDRQTDRHTNGLDHCTFRVINDSCKI